MDITKQVIFKVGNEDYGFDILLVNAIEKYAGVVSIPNSPDFILGMVNLRGEIIPVFSLRKKFGLPEIAPDDKTQLIVTRSNDMLVGFKVDSVDEIVEIRFDEIQAVPSIVRASNTKYARSIASKSGKLAILIDHDGVISEEEQELAGNIIKNNS